MIVFSADASADHGALTRRWLDERPVSEACLATVWEAERGGAYAPSAAAYRDAVRLVLAHAWDDGDVPPPVWFEANGWPTGGITPFGARLVDALAFHVGAMLGADRLGWEVSTDNRYLHAGEPVVRGHADRCPTTAIRVGLLVARGESPLERMDFPFAVDPALAAGAPGPALAGGDVDLERARRGGRTLLRRSPRRWDGVSPRENAPSTPAALTIDGEAPAARPLGVDVLIPEVTLSDLAPEYTHQIWVDAAAESEWGGERYRAHTRNLASEPGIEKVLGEDREVIHVYAPTLTAAQVLAAARRAAGA